MTVTHNIILAWSYLRTHFRRHVFIILILGFSFGIIMAVTTLTAGMEQSVFRIAELHYGGHVFIFGHDPQVIRLPQPGGIIRSLQERPIAYKKAALRTLSYMEGVLYFAGSATKQKYVFGIDWENEREAFQDHLFVDDLFPETLADNGIIISSSMASRLHARQGDDVTLSVLTKDKQTNTGTFVVRGIIKDASIFGYFKCYVDRQRLNALLGFDPDDCSWIGFYWDNRDPAFLSARAEEIYQALKDRYPMVPPADTREEFANVFSVPSPALELPVFTLNAYISQVSDLLSSMRLVSYFVYVTMLIIALASMSVSYRLILHERSREIGTLRVMGLSALDTQVLLLVESVMVVVIAVGVGLWLSLLFNWVLSLFSYSQIPGFDIFLYKGRLTAAYPPSMLLMNIVILLLTVLPAAWIPALRISRIDVTKALSKQTL